MPGRTAILVVNGFDRLALWSAPFDQADAERYPWIEVCLREVRRRSGDSDYELLVWDNSQLRQLRAVARRYDARLYPSDEELSSGERSRLVLSHAVALQQLFPLISDEFDFVMTLDTDAFPIQDGWIELLKARVQDASLTGIWRDEMPTVQPYVHPSCLFARRQRLIRIEDPFSRRGVQDVGQRITLAITDNGEKVAGLHRSNARNAHFLIGGLYGDLVYHHAAGSRAPVFWMTEGRGQDERVYKRLREAVFDDLDRVVAVLRGESDDDLGLGWA
jgi:hypothetical protein